MKKESVRERARRSVGNVEDGGGEINGKHAENGHDVSRPLALSVTGSAAIVPGPRGFGAGRPLNEPAERLETAAGSRHD